jgi:hypothetical protein
VLVALQGVLYAIGGALLYAPCISYMSEWFVARRGFANGLLFAGELWPPRFRGKYTSFLHQVLLLEGWSCHLACQYSSTLTEPLPHCASSLLASSWD